MLRNFFKRRRESSEETPAPSEEAAKPAKPRGATAAPASVISPERLCGVDPETMSPVEIRQHLATLYKRHNAAASSLNPQLREEAEKMLDAIVACREKYVE